MPHPARPAAAPRREPWRSRPSDHFDPVRQQFLNPWKNTDKRFTELLRWWTTGTRAPWPRHVANRPYAPAPAGPDCGEAVITWIGHASMLVRVGRLTLLTDPHFSTHAGPFGRVGARRVRRPGLERTQLPPIDAVFVSHNHYDHLDVASLRWLDRHREPLFITCLGLKRFLERRGLRRVVELDWWESIAVGDAELVVTPAQHWSNRAMLDLRRSLWGGCWLRHPDGATVYYAGDSGYAPCFSLIRERLGPPGLALLPIGAYEPRWFMRDYHMNPEDAVRAHQDLEAACSVAIHHACFRLTDEGFDEPARALRASCAARGVALDDFRLIDVGETLVLDAARATLRRAGGRS